MASFEDRCRAALSLVPVYFAVVSGQVCTQSDMPIHAILSHVFHHLAVLDARLQPIATPAGEAALICAIYDPDTRPLVEASAADLPLDPQHKARLLVQGIAGAVSVARQISASKTTSLQRTLDSFSPVRIRAAVEHSHLFSECLMPSEVLDLIVELALAHDDPVSGPGLAPATHHALSFDDYTRDVFCSERERAVANSMGMPWGLSFMVLN